MTSTPTALVVRWPAEAIWEAVAPRLPGFTVEILPSIDSTNTELMRRARAGQHAPILLVAEQQTAGRGRLGRTWHSGHDETRTEAGPLPSLMFSLGLPLAPKDWSGLSLAVGLSLAQTLQPHPPSAADQPRLGLKWPNDLWLCDAERDRKLGGILIETASFVGTTAPPQAPDQRLARYVVIGVGLNLLPRRAEGLSTPPAWAQELDPALDGPTALLRVVPPLVAAVQAFVTEGFAPLQSAFAARDVLRGRPVTLSDGQTGLATGVGPDGSLQVQTAQGLYPVTSAEVSVRPLPPAVP